MRRTYDSRTSLYEIDSLKQTFPYTGMRLQHTLLQNNLTTRVSDSSTTLAVQALGNAGTQQRFFPFAQSVTDSQYELGGALNGALVSQAVSRKLIQHSFYEEILLQDGHQLDHVIPPRDLQSWQQLPVSFTKIIGPAIVKNIP